MSQMPDPDRPPASERGAPASAALAAAVAAVKPRWYEALLAWYLGWLGRVFSGKL